jgi:hypothetical protein
MILNALYAVRFGVTAGKFKKIEVKIIVILAGQPLNGKEIFQ